MVRTTLTEPFVTPTPHIVQRDGPPSPRRVLIVEDDVLARRHLQRILLEDPGLSVVVADDAESALRELTEGSYSIALVDLRLPGIDGMDLLAEVQKRSLPVTVIVVTGQGGVEEAVQALRLGAYDFLTKPIDVDNLRLVIERALRDCCLRDELASLRSQLQTRYCFHNILSKNPQMHGVFELIGNLSHTNATVLIEGETGTGKEQIARAIHYTSLKKAGPLIAVNCAALPETLLESELFGHEKGAFTSAVGQRQGRFELAHGGTIFLDEVGDVPATMQAKLLRVLQERRFERVGGTESIEIDVRVIAATNRSLQKLVKKGSFRKDLYYRLNVVKIEVPPLRDRMEDVPLLATHFAQKYARPGEEPKRVAPQAMEVLLNYHWPGNVRELENAIERACVTSRDELIQVENLPGELENTPRDALPFPVALDRPLPQLLRETAAYIERQYLSKALKKANGNVGVCAKICGLSRRCISDKIAEYQFDKTAFKDSDRPSPRRRTRRLSREV
jgi:DNA-binding NtrC family response regulator